MQRPDPEGTSEKETRDESASKDTSSSKDGLSHDSVVMRTPKGKKTNASHGETSENKKVNDISTKSLTRNATLPKRSSSMKTPGDKAASSQKTQINSSRSTVSTNNKSTGARPLSTCSNSTTRSSVNHHADPSLNSKSNVSQCSSSDRPKSSRTRTLSQEVCYLKELRDPNPLTLSYIEDGSSTSGQDNPNPINNMAASCYGNVSSNRRYLGPTKSSLANKYCVVHVQPKETVILCGRKLPQYFTIHPEWSSEKVALVNKDLAVQLQQHGPSNTSSLCYPFTSKNHKEIFSTNPLWPRRCQSLPRNDYKNPITWETVKPSL